MPQPKLKQTLDLEKQRKKKKERPPVASWHCAKMKNKTKPNIILALQAK